MYFEKSKKKNKALKHAPMSLVIVMRNASPLAALCMERFYPEPIRISRAMVAAIVTLGLLPFF